MAASLRAAAMRLLRPAALPGAGLRRLVHTEQQHSTPHCQIKQKTEELFDLITKAEAISATTSNDRHLLKYLSTRVKPRPNDPQWRNLIKKKVVTGTLVTVAIVAYALALRGVNDYRPKIVEYNGYKVTDESLPMLQAYQSAANAEGLHKHDGYQPAPTSELVRKQ